MKILYVTTVGITMRFFKQFIKTLLDEGHTVDIATNETEYKIPDCYREWHCGIYHIDTARSPLSKGNLTAIKQIKKLVEAEKYNIVHCHTPIAALCTRFACRNVRKQGTKVFYTAHGFHFYKGAPKKNWLIYYPIEKICSYFTDTLITINTEDYELAKKKMKAKNVECIPGVGIDTASFNSTEIDVSQKRKELGVPENAILLLSVGELNENKNHETVIRAIKDMDVYYVIAGTGELQDKLQGLIKELAMSHRVKLLGYRNDISELCKTSDIFVFPSFREGLPVSVMEAMAAGLPVICSEIRGNTDLIKNGDGGFLCKAGDINGFAEKIRELSENHELRKRMQEANPENIKKFDAANINKIMKKIYEEVLYE